MINESVSITFTTEEVLIASLKKKAKRLKKEIGCTHSEALDSVAEESGYQNWSLLVKRLSFKKQRRNKNGYENR